VLSYTLYSAETAREMRLIILRPGIEAPPTIRRIGLLIQMPQTRRACMLQRVIFVTQPSLVFVT
jgi:hypothetical protein